MSNIKRLKNILSGDYKATTKVQSGYEKISEEHVEGDIWEAGGKTWTIKNGIKQTYTKLNSIRQLIHTPLTCPKCNQLLKTQIDKKMYRLRDMCLNCVAEEDTKMIVDGTFDTYQKDYITKNVNSWLKDLETKAHEYIDSRESESFVTEDGQIEEWSNGYSPEQLKQLFSEQIEKFKSEFSEYTDSKKEA